MINRSETATTKKKQRANKSCEILFCCCFIYFALVWWQVAKAIKKEFPTKTGLLRDQGDPQRE